MLFLVFLRSAHLCLLCCPFPTSHPALPGSLFLLKLISFQSFLPYELLEHLVLPLPSHLQLCVSYLSPRRTGLHLLCSCVKHMIGAHRCSVKKSWSSEWLSVKWMGEQSGMGIQSPGMLLCKEWLMKQMSYFTRKKKVALCYSLVKSRFTITNVLFLPIGGHYYCQQGLCCQQTSSLSHSYRHPSRLGIRKSLEIPG